MKILDRYILKTYLKTFIAVFIILMMIFILQAIWLYIKELAGKDLDISTVFKFLFYITPTLIPLILPLTILLSSIMVFGNFSENYEFAAMKSTGISLQRAMASLSVFVVILGIVTFFFSNNVIPWAEFNSYNLRKNIAKLKPAMAIVEGQFNDVTEDFNIKVSDKTGERGQYLKDVIIHKGSGNNLENNVTIIAKTGELVSSKDSDVLKLVLNDGYYYDDTPPKKYNERKKKPFVKSLFKKYTINVDLSGINNVNLDEQQVDNRYTMLDIYDLSYTIDSLKTKRVKTITDFSETLFKRTNLKTLNNNIKPKDSALINQNVTDVVDLFTPKQRVRITDYAINNISSTKKLIESKRTHLYRSDVWLNKHIQKYHEKFALGFACIILFFVGAPLGALIRKGGFGLPMVIAIVLFLTYHFIGIFAKNGAKDGSFNPALSAWVSTLIMLPLSVYLTSRATQDRGIFEFDHITIPIKNWFRKVFKLKAPADLDIDNDNLELTEARILQFQPKIKDYKLTSKLALVVYTIALVLFILFFVFRNNKLPQLAEASIQISGIAFIAFVFLYSKASLLFGKLRKQLFGGSSNPLLTLIGFILYPITHFSRKSKLPLSIR